MSFSDQQLEIIQPNIEKYVNGIVFCDKDAEDIIQNVNLILIKKRLEFNPSKKLLHWALRFVVSKLKNIYKIKKDGTEGMLILNIKIFLLYQILFFIQF